jgi:dephospho-CoA kinase
MRYSILVSGKIGSGKSHVSNYLTNQFHIPVVSFGRMIAAQSTLRGFAITRKNLQNFGYEMFTSLGPRLLVEEAIKLQKLQNTDALIFDGVRHELVLFEIKKMSRHVMTIFLKADQSTRYNRYRSKYDEKELSLIDFMEIDEHPIEKGIDNLEKYADVIIDASGELENVYLNAFHSVNQFISKHRS